MRAVAASSGLRTAAKPDSQDVCFVLGGAGTRLESDSSRTGWSCTPACRRRLSGEQWGPVPAVELVTVGQRRGLGGSGGSGGERRFAVRVDVERRRVEVGSEKDLLGMGVALTERTWVRAALPPGSQVLAQSSAHGRAFEAVVTQDGLAFMSPRRRVAPGQTIALYVGDEVVGSGIARRDAA